MIDNKAMKEINKNYLINPEGFIYSIYKKRYLKPHKRAGYLQVRLKIAKRDYRTLYVHRVIASQWVPNPEGKPCVNHIDGNKENNWFSNLEWCTYKENTKHALDSGLMDLSKFNNGREHMFKGRGLSALKLLNNSGFSQRDLAEIFGCSQCYISLVLNNKR